MQKFVLALYGTAVAELRSVTCHMKSHSVTCHPTQTMAPPFKPSLSQKDQKLSWPWCWLYTKMVYLSAYSYLFRY